MVSELKEIETNPNKAAGKTRTNSTLMGVCLTIFGLLWAFSPERLTPIILLQFVLAIPLLYISNVAYTRVSYREKTKAWDYLGWFTGTTAVAFVLNVIGILIFFLGNSIMALFYFFIIWGLLFLTSIINVSYGKKPLKMTFFKLFYFILIQFAFGIYVLYF